MRQQQTLRRTTAAAVAAALLASSTLVLAQPNDYPGQRNDRQPGRHATQQAPRHQAHGPQHRHDSPNVQAGRGAGPDHNWYRGGRVPPQYRTRHYVVNDWRAHHLSPPPRGYYWVQNGSDYLLVAIATGVIAQLILAN
ncbi:MAG: RcnB family protein [Acidovorax sp.]|uniref:RcnB family protein n=1 Tax=Acidovorax sp. TaxID=1872122 RepID=UPI0039E4947F